MFGKIDGGPDDGHLDGSIRQTGDGIREFEFSWLDGDFGVSHVGSHAAPSSVSATSLVLRVNSMTPS